MPSRRWERTEEWEQAWVCSWLALGWPKLMALCAILISACLKELLMQLPVWFLLTHGHVPSHLVGGCSYFQCFLLSCCASGKDDSTRKPCPGHRELLPDAGRELGCLLTSSVEKQAVMTPWCERWFSVKYLGYGSEGMNMHWVPQACN